MYTLSKELAALTRERDTLQAAAAARGSPEPPGGGGGGGGALRSTRNVSPERAVLRSSGWRPVGEGCAYIIGLMKIILGTITFLLVPELTCMAREQPGSGPAQHMGH